MQRIVITKILKREILMEGSIYQNKVRSSELKIEDAVDVCVLENGEIAQSGTYQELMHQDGLFTQLAKRQIS